MTFLPLAFRLAARLSQVSIADALASPGLLAACLRDLQRLLGSGLVVNHFDLPALAQAGGCEVERTTDGYRILSTPPNPSKALASLARKGALREALCVATLLEATARLATELHGLAGVVGVVPGPMTLAAQMRGEQDLPGSEAEPLLDLASEVAVQLVTEYCERGVAMVLVAEERVQLPPASAIARSKGALRPVWNVARYFDRPSLYLIRGDLDPPSAAAALAIGAARVALPPGLAPDSPPTGQTLCATLPLALLGTPLEQARRALVPWLSASVSGGGLVVTEWEIPAGADIQTLQTLTTIIERQEATP